MDAPVPIIKIWKSELPNGFHKVDHIEFTDGAFIDTGIILNNKKIVITYSMTQYVYDAHIFGTAFGISQGSTQPHFTSFGSSEHHYYWGQNGTEYHSAVGYNRADANVEWSAGTHTLIMNEYDADDETYSVYLDDVLLDVSSDPFEVNSSMLIGRRDNTANFVGNVYEVKVYDNVTSLLENDLVMCRHVSGESGMYDKMLNVFHVNEGSGSLIAGNDVESTPSYYEVEDVVKLPVIDRQENRAGSFSFSVTYDATADNILSPSFDGWSDESEGAVDWGMRVTIDNVADNVETRVAEGIISTITPTEHLLSFECADMLAVLRAKGAELHRNYYNSATYTGWFNAVSGEGEGDSTVAVDISAISNAGGTPIDPIKYRVRNQHEWSYNTTYTITGYNTLEWRFTADHDFCQINVYFISGGSNLTVTLFDSSSSLRPIYTGYLSVYDHDLNVLNGTTVYPAGYYILRIKNTTNRDSVIGLCTGSSSDGSIYRGTAPSQFVAYGSMARIFTYYTDNTVTAWTRNGNRLLITGITGVTIDSTTKPDLISPAANRANIPYTSGSIQTTEIMDHIKKVALDDNINAVIDSSVFGNAPSVGLFRTGGGYALDYLKKLADIATSSGRQLSFALDGSTLRIGARRMESDNANLEVIEGTLNDHAMIGLNLTKTIKGRPSRAMLRGTLSNKTENKPIMAVLRNASLASARCGIYTDTVITDSASLSVPDMMASAFASVNSSVDGWEGTLVLSGIVTDMIDSSGAYAGSGKVISITALHHGIVSKNFKVVAVTYDYDKLTTTVTLTNAMQIYSSDLAESVVEALTAGDMSVSSSGSDLYKTQFLYQYSFRAETTLTSGNVVKIKTSDNVEYTLGDVAVYLLPNGRKLIYGAISITGSSSNAKYRVQYYQINGGAWREIPARDRCDAYNGQYVILNVDCPQ